MAHNAESVLEQIKERRASRRDGETSYHLDKVISFDGFPNEEEDRNRLIAFLKDKDLKLSTVV
jgi:hypothetical protein